MQAACTASALQGPALVREGDNVILDENGEKKTFVKMKKAGHARIGKSQLCTDPFLGVPYGAVFTLAADGKSMHRVQACPQGEWATQHVLTTMRNNAELCDRNEEHQKLTHEDIAAMKASGKEGAEIVEALISNSATFQSKTEFSQEKYRKKKTKKYVVNITLRRPTALTICQSYYDKGPARVFNLRPDSLGIMLSLANVAAGAKVLVMDACVGVVMAAVVERLGGYGKACRASIDSSPSTDAIKLLNLTPAQASVMCAASLDALQDAKALGPAWQPQEAAQAPEPSSTTTAPTTAPDASASTSGAPSKAPSGAAAAASGAGGAASAASPSLVGTSPAALAASATPTAQAASPSTAAHARAQPAGGCSGQEGEQGGRAQAAPGPGSAGAAADGGPQVGTAEAVGPSAMEVDAGSAQLPGMSSGQGGAGQGNEQQQQQQQQQQQLQGEGEGGKKGAQKGGQEGATSEQQQQQQGGKRGGPQDRQEAAARQQALLHSLVHPGFNSCIIAVPRLDPISVMREVMPLLQPSAPFVVFSQWVQPLADCLHFLLTTHQAVLLQLHESWMRPYQVLPARSHPHMMASGTGGFMLSGVKVLSGREQGQQQKDGQVGSSGTRKRDPGQGQQGNGGAKRQR